MTVANPHGNPEPTDEQHSQTTQEQVDDIERARTAALKIVLPGDLIYKLNELQGKSFVGSGSNNSMSGDMVESNPTSITDDTLDMMKGMIKREREQSTELGYHEIVKPYHDYENKTRNIRAFFRIPSTSKIPDYSEFSKHLNSDDKNCKTNREHCF